MGEKRRLRWTVEAQDRKIMAQGEVIAALREGSERWARIAGARAGQIADLQAQVVDLTARVQGLNREVNRLRGRHYSPTVAVGADGRFRPRIAVHPFRPQNLWPGYCSVCGYEQGNDDYHDWAAAANVGDVRRFTDPTVAAAWLNDGEDVSDG